MASAVSGEAAAPSVVRVEIPARAEWVAVARLTVAAVASRLRFSVDEIDDIKLAIAEACTTAIQNDTSGSGSISIMCEATTEQLTITVNDSVPRKPFVAADPGGSDGSRMEDLGVFLIRALMDTVDHTSGADGSQLVMTKRVS